MPALPGAHRFGAGPDLSRLGGVEHRRPTGPAGQCRRHRVVRDRQPVPAGVAFAVAASDSPHESQNLALGATEAPQYWQFSSSLLPHSAQKRAPSRFWALQDGQCIVEGASPIASAEQSTYAANQCRLLVVSPPLDLKRGNAPLGSLVRLSESESYSGF